MVIITQCDSGASHNCNCLYTTTYYHHYTSNWAEVVAVQHRHSAASIGYSAVEEARVCHSMVVSADTVRSRQI